MTLSTTKAILQATLQETYKSFGVAALGAEPLKTALEAIAKLEKLEGAIGTVLAESTSYDDDEYGQGFKDAIEKVLELSK